jgi:hypothetical protein
MEETKKPAGKWKCNYCGETKNVTNGICPNCGPAQTTPIDDIAKKEAGVLVEESPK